jgi:cephalosporin hydroxylase
MAWRSLMYLLWSHAIASTMTCNRTAHLKDHYAMYHRHGEVLLDYGDGTCPLTYDDLAYGYETMLMDPKNNNQYFRFFGIVSQQDPMDVLIMQELFEKIKPNLIIETGTLCGGGALLFAHLLALYGIPNAKVLTFDIVRHKFCDKNREINAFAHPLWAKYEAEGRLEAHILPLDTPGGRDRMRDMVRPHASSASAVFITEDSAHERTMVINNFLALHEFVTVGSYYLIQDTRLDRDCEDARLTKTPDYRNYKKPHKPYCRWYINNGPAAAMRILRSHEAFRANFLIDRSVEKYILTQHPGGWCKRTV